MGSPLTLGKSKRWLARRRVTCEAPDRCEARECVQERRRAATKRRITQALFFCAGFSVPPCSVRVTRRDSSAGPVGSPLLCLKLQLAPTESAVLPVTLPLPCSPATSFPLFCVLCGAVLLIVLCAVRGYPASAPCHHMHYQQS